MVQNILWKCIAVFGWLFFAFPGVEAANADDSSKLPARCPVEIGGQVFTSLRTRCGAELGKIGKVGTPHRYAHLGTRHNLKKLSLPKGRNHLTRRNISQ